MGLDMFLYRKTYINHFDKNIKYKINIMANDLSLNINPEKVSEITEDIGYWRKANAIHKWFVDNVQDGEDNCELYVVYKEELQNLHDTCLKVLENHSLAEELLPSASGFFFGGTEYDDWYFQSLEDTVKICKEALSLFNNDLESSNFYYQSSW